MLPQYAAGYICTDSGFWSVKDYRRIAQEKNLSLKVGNIVSSDIFYNEDNSVNDRWKKMNVLAVDMEQRTVYECGKMR